MFGFVHLYNGQEAVSTGVIGAMKRQHDWFTARIAITCLNAGVPAREVMRSFSVRKPVAAKAVVAPLLFSKEHLLGGYAFIEGIPVALSAAFTSRYCVMRSVRRAVMQSPLHSLVMAPAISVSFMSA